MKTCSDVRARLHDYLEEHLPPAERQGTTAHLQECAECRTALKELRCTRRLLRRLPRDTMPDPMKHTILDALRRTPESDS